jgi:O-antigen/teichoic acid export membrane protein
MSDVQGDSLSMKDNLMHSRQEARNSRDLLAEDTHNLIESDDLDDTIGDDVETTKWPSMRMSRLASPVTPLPLQFLQPGIDRIWLSTQETWMLPAMPKSAKKGTLALTLPAAQGPVEQVHQQPEVQDEHDQSAPALPATKSEQTNAGAQSYLSLALDMVKNSGIYAVGALASPLVSLILTPFLAHHLSTNDYGGLAVLYTVVDLVTVMTQLGLSSAFFRAYNGDYESAQDRLGVLASSIILLLLASLPIAIVMMITAPWLSVVLFNSPDFSGPVRLTALVIVMENLTLPGISWLRAEKRAAFYTCLSIVGMLSVLGTNILLVGVLHLGVNGALIAKGAGYVVMVCCTLPMMLVLLTRKRSLRLRPDIVQNMLSFGIPTIFSDIAAWVLQLSDRYLLSHFGSLSQTAGYSVAYVLGGVLSPVILSPWGLAWVPIMYAVAKRNDAARIFQLVFRWWSSVLLLSAFALSLVSIVVLELLFPPAYLASEPVIPIITLSTMLMGVWYIFMIGVNIRRKTILEFVFVVIAAVVNLLLNLFLIPEFGAMGAAVSTLLAYAVLVVVSYVVNQRIYPVNFEIGTFTFKLAVGVALYVGATLLAQRQKPLIGGSIFIVVLILYCIFLMFLGGLSVKKLTKVFGYVKAAIRKEGKKAYA